MTNVEEETELEVEPKDRLLLPGEVAELFHVNAKTVTRWAKAGRIGCIKTLGGHRRFRESEVLKAMASLEEFKTEEVKA